MLDFEWFFEEKDVGDVGFVERNNEFLMIFRIDLLPVCAGKT